MAKNKNEFWSLSLKTYFNRISFKRPKTCVYGTHRAHLSSCSNIYICIFFEPYLFFIFPLCLWQLVWGCVSENVFSIVPPFINTDHYGNASGSKGCIFFSCIFSERDLYFSIKLIKQLILFCNYSTALKSLKRVS